MTQGPVTKAVRSAIRAARKAGLNETDEARAALAIQLAQTLDDGAGMATAAVSRELRATLGDLPVPDFKESVVDDLARRRASRRSAKTKAPASTSRGEQRRGTGRS